MSNWSQQWMTNKHGGTEIIKPPGIKLTYIFCSGFQAACWQASLAAHDIVQMANKSELGIFL